MEVKHRYTRSPWQMRRDQRDRKTQKGGLCPVGPSSSLQGLGTKQGTWEWGSDRTGTLAVVKRASLWDQGEGAGCCMLTRGP